jgi:hypothetical protein
MSYEQDLVRTVGMGIPCMHMPALPMAMKAVNEFKKYALKFKESNLTIDDMIADIENQLEKYAGK